MNRSVCFRTVITGLSSTMSATVMALFQAAHQNIPGTSVGAVRIVAGVLALVMVFVILFRRKREPATEKEEDEY